MLGAAQSFLERKFSRILREPPSVGVATGVIVSATAVVVVGSGALIWALDHNEYPNIWVGMWWALQTVTTVGYGDVTPAHWSGRLIAAVVMLYGIAFLAIVTAAITSTFVARAARERQAEHSLDELTELQRLETRFDELDLKLDRIEAALRGRQA